MSSQFVPVGVELNMEAAAPLGMSSPADYASVRVPAEDKSNSVAIPNAHPLTHPV